MPRSRTTIAIAVLISFGLSLVFIDVVGRPTLIVLLSLLIIASVLCRGRGILSGAVLITLLTQIPGALEVGLTVGILFIAALTVALLRSLSPDLPNTPPRRTTRRDTTTATNHAAGALECDPTVLDFDTASVFADQGSPDVQTGTDTDSTSHQTARDRSLSSAPTAGSDPAPAEAPRQRSHHETWGLIPQDDLPNETVVGRWWTISDGVQHFITIRADQRHQEFVAPYEVEYTWRTDDNGIVENSERLQEFDNLPEAVSYAVRWKRQHPTGGPGPPQDARPHYATNQNDNL